MRRARLPSRALRALSLVLFLTAAGCGDSRDDIAPALESAQLIVGNTAGEWGLLAIPRGGGVASLRLIARPDSAVWTGSEELPVLIGVWPVGETGAVLMTEDSTVLRYEPADDSLEEIMTLDGDGRLASVSPAGVVFIDSAGLRLRVVEPDRAVDVVGGDVPLGWAGAMQGGIAALTGPTPHELLRIVPGNPDSTGASTLDAAGRPPAMVTAWGERVVLTTPDGEGIRVFAFEEGWSLAGEVSFGDSVTALAASPSSHEIYVGLASPPRIERVSRYSFEARRMAETSATPDDIRPSLFGDALLVHSSAGIERVGVGGGASTRLAGQWREDLPLGLPAGVTLFTTEDETRRVSVFDTATVVLDGGAPAWWVPVRWNPARLDTPALVDALAGDDRETGEDAAVAPSGGEGREAEEIVVPTVGSEREVEPGGGPPGYYAIVTSARQRAGVDALLSSLEAAGYPTRVQAYPDEAGEVWYRGLVGPFPTRARAQAAARQLLRERDLQAWVTEIGVSG